jgi:hypothetical protein
LCEPRFENVSFIPLACTDYRTIGPEVSAANEGVDILAPVSRDYRWLRCLKRVHGSRFIGSSRRENDLTGTKTPSLPTPWET